MSMAAHEAIDSMNDIMFEVEARGELTVSLDQIIPRFRKLNAKFLGKTRRFSLIYLRNKSADKNDQIDLRIRVTNCLSAAPFILSIRL